MAIVYATAAKGLPSIAPVNRTAANLTQGRATDDGT